MTTQLSTVSCIIPMRISIANDIIKKELIALYIYARAPPLSLLRVTVIHRFTFCNIAMFINNCDAVAARYKEAHVVRTVIYKRDFRVL